jgi:hypothetical protein
LTEKKLFKEEKPEEKENKPNLNVYIVYYYRLVTLVITTIYIVVNALVVVLLLDNIGIELFIFLLNMFVGFNLWFKTRQDLKNQRKNMSNRLQHD